MKHRIRDASPIKEILDFANARWDLDEYRELHSKTVALLTLLEEICAARKRRPEPGPAGTVPYREFLRWEAHQLLAILDLHEEIRPEALFVQMGDHSFVLGLLDLALGVQRGVFEIRRCRFADCRGFFPDERKSSHMKYCCRRCRITSNNRSRPSDYFTAKKRESRKRLNG